MLADAVAVPEQWVARGVAVGDLDDDGDPDVVVSTRRPRPVLRNDGGTGNTGSMLRLEGPKTNRDGIGAEVRLVTGRACATLPRVHGRQLSVFGRQPRSTSAWATRRRSLRRDPLAVRGPSRRFENVAAGQTLTATEPAR